MRPSTHARDALTNVEGRDDARSVFVSAHTTNGFRPLGGPPAMHFYSLGISTTILGCAGNMGGYARPADADHIANVFGCFLGHLVS